MRSLSQLACTMLFVGVYPVVAQQHLPDSVHLFEPGLISCGDYESHPAFSPDGKVLCFIKCTPDINSSCTLFFSSLGASGWMSPVVAPFSGQYYDIDPFFTPEGSTLYFCSNRPLKPGDPSKGDTDIWRVSRTSIGWGQPEHLGSVNSPADEYYPTLSNAGNLYFGSTRDGRSSDIFYSRWHNGVFEPPMSLGDPVNSAENEYEPFIAPDESYLLFMATKTGGLLTADIFISFPRGSAWSSPVSLPEPINSKYTEWSPKVTHDGKRLFFSSTRSRPIPSHAKRSAQQIQELLHSPGNGLGDIYSIDVGDFLYDKKKY